MVVLVVRPGLGVFFTSLRADEVVTHQLNAIVMIAGLVGLRLTPLSAKRAASGQYRATGTVRCLPHRGPGAGPRWWWLLRKHKVVS